MGKAIRGYKIPAGSIILDGYEKIDYWDTFHVQPAACENVDIITTKIFKVPDWVSFLMRIRNFIVSFFGLKTGETEKIKEAAYYPVGSRAVYFTVINRNDGEIVMSENDKHLEFRTSVMINKNDYIVNLTTVVRYNNVWGRVYFFFVRPFHQIIMKSLLKRL